MRDPIRLVVVALLAGFLGAAAAVGTAVAGGTLTVPQSDGTNIFFGNATITDGHFLKRSGRNIVGQAGGGGGAPTDAEYVVGAANGGLSAERVVTNTATVTWDLGTGSQAKADVPNDAITYAKLQNVSATDRLLGRDTAAAGDAEEIAVGGGIEFTGGPGIQRSALTGDVTASAGSGSTTIANDAVTYAKMQNVSATDKVLGRSTAGSGDVEEIACTSAGRALLDDADAAAQRTTLGVWATVVKSSDQSGIGTSPTDVTGLSVSVLNGQTIRFRAYIRHEQDSAGIASMFSVNGPSASFATFNIQEIITATGVQHNALDSFNARTVQGTGGFIGEVTGVVKFSADGTFVVRAKSETGGTITVREGSWVEYLLQ